MKEEWHLLSPPHPVVGHICSPSIKPSWDTLLFKCTFEVIEWVQTVLLPIAQTCTDDNISLTVFINKPAVVLVPNVIWWWVLINNIIIAIILIVVEETSIIDTWKGDNFREDIWMLEEEIERVVGPIEQPVVIIPSNQPVLCLIKGIASSITYRS